MAIDINDLFSRINELCSIPFSRLEPLQSDLRETSAPKVQKLGIKLPQLPIYCNTTKLNNNKRAATKLVKTRTEVEDLFKEIGNFCSIKLPFKLNDLDEADEIKSDLTNINTEKVLIPEVQNDKPILSNLNQSVHAKRPNFSFANLLFDFNDKKTKNIKRINQKKQLDRRNTSNKSSKSGPLKPKQEISVIESPISPLCLSSISLKSSINSCRSYIKSVKVNEASKENSTNLKKRPIRKKAIESMSRDDSIESGYSSGTSSVPSPASTLLSTDSLDESQTKKSSMSSNISTCTENSLSYNVNPNGEVVYIQSQYDFYLDKTSRRKRKAICDINLDQPLNGSNLVDHHQKVIEWQSKTLLNNQCPTPQHNHFDDTPPHSPQQVCDNNIFNQLPDMTEANFESKTYNDDDILDFDCLQTWFENQNNGNDDTTDSTTSPDEIDMLLAKYEQNFDCTNSLDIDYILS